MCAVCRRVLETRPTSHKCIAGATCSHQPLVAAEHHRSDECEVFHSRKGLDNHKKRHHRDTARMAWVSTLLAAGTNKPGAQTTNVTSSEPPREPDPVELLGDTVSPEPPRNPTSGKPKRFLPMAEPAPDEEDANITLSGRFGDATNPTTDENQRELPLLDAPSPAREQLCSPGGY